MPRSAAPHSSRREVLVLLRKRDLTARQLAEEIGVTSQAVRDQLRTLEGEGLVRVSGMRRDTGGKPAKEYTLTREGEETFEKPYPELLRMLVSEMQEELGETRERAILRAVGRRAASEALGDRLPDPVAAGDLPRDELRRRLDVAAEVLDALGGAAELQVENDRWRIQGHGCPLSGLVDERPEACVLAEALIETLTGVGVREACDRSDRPRCAFDVEFEPPNP